MSTASASGPMFERVYAELVQLARARLARGLGGQSLGATALVHEVWVKLAEGQPVASRDRSHFLATAAQAMRWILVDRARRRGRLGRAELSVGGLAADSGPAEDELVLALDVALERFERLYPELAQVVLLRHFAGLSVEEVAVQLARSTATVKRQWRFAKSWLLAELGPDGAPGCAGEGGSERDS